jgi:SAM-dependent methyltransferase
MGSAQQSIAEDRISPAVKHLPYEIDPSQNRFHYYETLWKRVALDLLKKHVNPAGKTLLDYGCGRGETLELFRAAGMKVSGTDTDPECVRLGARFGTTALLDTQNPVAQFGAKSFDVVTCFHVLEHVPSPLRTLQDIAAIAREYALLAVPNLRFLYWPFKKDFQITMINEGHLQGWDHWHFRNLAERHCGLELVEWGSDATILPLSGIMERLLGTKTLIKFETGLFRKIFPYHCLSVLGLFRVKK